MKIAIDEGKGKKHSSPYMLGLFCLLPFVGAIVGFGLIFYGIKKYKDKWLILIGIVGLFITAYCTLSIHQNIKNTPNREVILTEMSKMQLYQVMKEVEFYRLQYGKYPDSLEQINRNDMTWITDPILSLSIINKNSRFNYKRTGDKYYLFSSGIDKKPHTSDDLYPNIIQSDSSKFGLIRELIR